jgi:hypothetical protein
MTRHIIDHPKERNPARRLAEFVRLDRVPRRIVHKEVRTRGPSRLTQFLRIARGRPV